jgi:uncharacterized membrane protein
VGAQGWIDVLARWLHIVSVVAWTGGAIFIASALRPAVSKEGGGSAAVGRAALRRYRPIVATATILVLVSGFAILAVRLSYVGFGNLGTAYQVVFGIKLLIALGLIGLAHASFARAAAAEDDEQAVAAAVPPTIALVAALLVMLLGVALHRF